MTDWKSNATRRGFLALAGSATLAGCGGFGGDLFENETPTIAGSALLDAVADDSPDVPETIPVSVEGSHLDGMAARARDHRSSVPAPLDADDLPNGAIRAELERTYEESTRHLDGASDASSPAARMERLRRARESARSVAAAYEAIDAGLSRADVRETASAGRDDVDAFRGRWHYVGDDPVRAVLVHERIEQLVGFAVRRLGNAVERSSRGPENPVAVGEFAGRVEFARAALDDAEYLYDRFESSLDDLRRIDGGLRAAGEASNETLADRREALPDGDLRDASSFVDRDVEGTPVARAMVDLHRGLDYADGLEDERATGQRASVVLSAYETRARTRAFDSLIERIEDGDHATVESADDVRAIRADAIRSVESAVASDANPALDRRVLAEVASGIEYADDELRRYDDGDEVPAARLTRELGQYVLVDAVARATPPTSAEVAEAIRTTV